MNDLKTELSRNFLGFVLLLCGIGLVHLGAHAHIDKEEDSGFAFIGMAGLALQVKHQKQDPKE